MFIEPNTEIWFMQNVPLTDEYNDTIYFANTQSQYSYFVTKRKFHLLKNSYQRVNRGYMRIAKSADDVYDCNYLAFQNTSYGDKWFYAFITGVEFVNNECCEVSYEIDVMQTYLFDYEILPSFIEREHAITDEVGDNIMPESLDCGEYVYNEYEVLGNSLWSAIGGTTLNGSYASDGEQISGLTECGTIVGVVRIVQSQSTGYLYNGIYGGLALYYFDSSNIIGLQALNDFIDGYTQKPDEIVMAYAVPKFAMANVSVGADHIISPTSFGSSQVITYPHIDGFIEPCGNDIDGYFPKNNKLFTYPYNFLSIDNCNGGNLILRYEYFENKLPQVVVSSTFDSPVTVQLRPINYKGVNQVGVPSLERVNNQGLNTETITLSDYPMCSWNHDAFRSWLSQNAVPMALGFVSTAIGVATGSVGIIATGNALASATANAQRAGEIYRMLPIGYTKNQYRQAKIDQNNRQIEFNRADSNLRNALQNGCSAVTNIMANTYSASIASNMIKGNTNSGNINVATKRQCFFTGRMSCKREYAERIDQFFSAFGYTTRLYKVPYTNHRENWWYTKTVDCLIKGTMPSDDLKTIASIYNNGIRFWRYGDNLGDFSLSNDIV